MQDIGLGTLQDPSKSEGQAPVSSRPPSEGSATLVLPAVRYFDTLQLRKWDLEPGIKLH